MTGRARPRSRRLRSRCPARTAPRAVCGCVARHWPAGPGRRVAADAARARQIAAFREEQAKNRALGAKGGRLTLESLQQQIAEGNVKELPIIIKADVQGSSEVLADTLAKLSDDKVKAVVLAIEADKRRLSLGVKQLQPDVWTTFFEQQESHGVSAVLWSGV